MQSFGGKPRSVAYTLAVRFRQHKQSIQLVFVGFFVNLQNHTSYIFAVKNDSVGFRIFRIHTHFNGFARYDFSVCINMIITFAEFQQCTVLERPLIVQYELLTVICC